MCAADMPDLPDLAALFPDISRKQLGLLNQLPALYNEWNAQINVISRKDMEHFVERHVMHSLALMRYLKLRPGHKVIDIGTGGGFPGIPLAICFPEVQFTLVDSIGKKIKVVQEVADALELKNVLALNQRAETVSGQYQYAMSRAVARLSMLVDFCTRGKFRTKHLLCLKGGDLREEIDEVDEFPSMVYNLNAHFPTEFFETKKVVYIQF